MRKRKGERTRKRHAIPSLPLAHATHAPPHNALIYKAGSGMPDLDVADAPATDAACSRGGAAARLVVVFNSADTGSGASV